MLGLFRRKASRILEGHVVEFVRFEAPTNFGQVAVIGIDLHAKTSAEDGFAIRQELRGFVRTVLRQTDFTVETGHEYHNVYGHYQRVHRIHLANKALGKKQQHLLINAVKPKYQETLSAQLHITRTGGPISQITVTTLELWDNMSAFNAVSAYLAEPNGPFVIKNAEHRSAPNSQIETHIPCFFKNDTEHGPYIELAAAFGAIMDGLKLHLKVVSIN